MTEVHITVDTDEVYALLRRNPQQLERALRGGTEDATIYILRQLQTYPPQRRGSTYHRTGTLRRSWSRRVEMRGLSVTGIVGSNQNIAPYNRQVQDRDRQSRVHRSRWTNTVQGVAERSEGRINGFYRDRIRAGMR